MQIHLNPAKKIKARLGLDANGPVQAFFTQTCYKAMDKYVPLRDNSLRQNVDIGKDYITYESPYAHAQYVGYTKGPVKHYTTPGTGPKWNKRMWSVEKDIILKQVENKIGGKL